MRVYGVILAGGAGRRFGGADKAALRLGGTALIDLAIQRLAPQCEALAISANGDLARFGQGCTVLPDAEPFGPLAGILAAMGWARAAGADFVASAAVDTPHFPCDLVARLRLALEVTARARIALAQGTRIHPTFGLWPVDLHDELGRFLATGANPKVQDFAAQHGLALARFADEAAFDNINTAADLARVAAAIHAAPL